MTTEFREEWQEAIARHNTLMSAAHLLIIEANAHCSNTQSDRLEAELEHYEVLPNGDMKTQPA